ncbi:MAG: cytidylate kinase-like family protein [Anaerolineae bacterium]|nr:cytidylate kinase-like family protein [Anaerolineae bacterium]
MAVITISRQVGSGGEAIARQVCDVLKYRYFDKQIMIEAASEVGLHKDHVVDYSEDEYEARHIVARLFRAGPRPIKTVAVKARDKSGAETLSEATIDEAQYVELVKNSIEAAYESGDMVILGRGGQAVLQDKANVLHIRVVAPTGTRIARLQREESLTVEEAQQRINQRDRATSEYLGRFFGIRWDDSTLYHLVINTGKLDVDAAVQLIMDAVVQLRAGLID